MCYAFLNLCGRIRVLSSFNNWKYIFLSFRVPFVAIEIGQLSNYTLPLRNMYIWLIIIVLPVNKMPDIVRIPGISKE